MQDVRGFLRWQFAGTFRNLTFWGFALSMVGLVAAVLGCPKPIPFWINVTGVIIILADAVRWYFRFTYRLYEMERNGIARALEKK